MKALPIAILIALATLTTTTYAADAEVSGKVDVMDLNNEVLNMRQNPTVRFYLTEKDAKKYDRLADLRANYVGNLHERANPEAYARLEKVKADYTSIHEKSNKAYHEVMALEKEHRTKLSILLQKKDELNTLVLEKYKKGLATAEDVKKARALVDQAEIEWKNVESKIAENRILRRELDEQVKKSGEILSRDQLALEQSERDFLRERKYLALKPGQDGYSSMKRGIQILNEQKKIMVGALVVVGISASQALASDLGNDGSGVITSRNFAKKSGVGVNSSTELLGSKPAVDPFHPSLDGDVELNKPATDPFHPNLTGATVSLGGKKDSGIPTNEDGMHSAGPGDMTDGVTEGMMSAQ